MTDQRVSWILIGALVVGCGGGGGNTTDGTQGATEVATSSSETTLPTTAPVTGETGTTPPGDTGTTAEGTTGTGPSSEPPTTTGDLSTGSGDTTAGNFCAGEGGILLPGDEVCTGDLGKKTFLFAVCLCDDLQTQGTIVTDALDSEMGLQMVDTGSVGVNGNYGVLGNGQIGGSLWVEQSADILNHGVARELQCGGDLTVNAPSTVDGDAYVGGAIAIPQGSLTIAGDLHISPPGNDGGASVQGAVIEEPVVVQTPCDCDDPIDIGSIVQGFKAVAENAAIGITQDELKDLQTTKMLELPCGVYAFSEISAVQGVHLVITGRVVIVVEGPVSVEGTFDVELTEGAELDLFVASDLAFFSPASIGSVLRPAATRVYTSGKFDFTGQLALSANLYMPNAIFDATGGVDMRGALFAGGLALEGTLAVHYDQAILNLDGCEDPGGGCGDCHDCANPTPTCDGGTCVPCQTDADCCPPLVCDQGACVGIIPG